MALEVGMAQNGLYIGTQTSIHPWMSGRDREIYRYGLSLPACPRQQRPQFPLCFCKGPYQIPLSIRPFICQPPFQQRRWWFWPLQQPQQQQEQHPPYRALRQNAFSSPQPPTRPTARSRSWCTATSCRGRTRRRRRRRFWRGTGGRRE